MDINEHSSVCISDIKKEKGLEIDQQTLTIQIIR